MRIPAERPPTPPGEMLLEEFLKPLGMTQSELAERIGVSYVRLNEIVNGRRGITPSTALRLAKALGTTPDFWLNSQLAVDLYLASHDEEELQQLERIQPVRDVPSGSVWLAGAGSVLTLRSIARYLPAITARRSTTTQIYEGTNQIQRMVMARQLLEVALPAVQRDVGPPRTSMFTRPLRTCGRVYSAPTR